jgi:glucuronoarabinoxylan endo-1,4-beta-xylanase
MSHFSKNVTGSTRLETSKDETTGRTKEELLADFEHSAYIKGDSIIVMSINATRNAKAMLIKLPYNVKSGGLWLSTGNEENKRCQKSALDISESTNEFITELPALSLSTYIFTIDKGSTAIENVNLVNDDDAPKTYYDLRGRRLETPHGLCIERSANGTSRKVIM